MDDFIPFEKVSLEDAKAKTKNDDHNTPRVAEKDWSVVRKRDEQQRRDLKGLLPWLSQLPMEVRPKALSVKYPRIANKLAELWRHPHACEKYMNELMMDQRGTRQGFPADVAQELAVLQTYFNTHVINQLLGIAGEQP